MYQEIATCQISIPYMQQILLTQILPSLVGGEKLKQPERTLRSLGFIQYMG